MAKKNEKKVNLKNYLYVLLIFVVLIVLTLYIFEWINVKKEEKLMNSYLISSKTITNITSDLNLFDQIKIEAPSSYFIFLGYTNDEYEYNLEKEIKRVIDNYGINELFYYIDVTNYKDDISKINEKLNVNLENVPAIIYVYEGKIIESNILDGINGNKLNVSELEKVLDIYDYEPVK